VKFGYTVPGIRTSASLDSLQHELGALSVGYRRTSLGKLLASEQPLPDWRDFC